MSYVFAPPDLWSTARNLLADMFAGGARAILTTLDSIARRAIKRRLLALEAVAMKLLLAEAAKLTDRGSSDPHHSATSAGLKTRAPFDPERPETWRVSFQLTIPPEPPIPDTGPRIRSLGPSRFVRAVVLGSNALAKRTQLAALRAARGSSDNHARLQAEKLARRFEALRRVLANPLPRARRLKRKLMALKRRAIAAAWRIVKRAPPPRQLDPLFHERAEYAAEKATPAFSVALDSS